MHFSEDRFLGLVQAMTQREQSQDGTGAAARDWNKLRSREKRKMPVSSYSTGIAGIIQEFLDESDLSHHFDEEKGVFTFFMRIRSYFRFVVVTIRVFEVSFMVTGESPIPAPYKNEKRMREVTEMLCRINFGLQFGAFDLDVNDGDFRFRRFVACADIVPSREMVNNALSTVSTAFRIYAKAAAEVFLGVSSAEDAVQRAEKGSFGGGDDA